VYSKAAVQDLELAENKFVSSLLMLKKKRVSTFQF
jgi:hypothetical protein